MCRFYVLSYSVHFTPSQTGCRNTTRTALFTTAKNLTTVHFWKVPVIITPPMDYIHSSVVLSLALSTISSLIYIWTTWVNVSGLFKPLEVNSVSLFLM